MRFYMLPFLSIQVEAVIQSLNAVFIARKSSIDEEWSQMGMPSSGKEFIRKNFPKLIEQLKEQGKLPALVFRWFDLYVNYYT